MAIVRLAGGILWRQNSGAHRIAVIHRPRQADWSLPKGRIDEGESWEEAALREVEEETGCEARIVSFAGAASYVPRRTPRLALYWHMELQRERRFEANKEIDELAWLPPAEALGRLDHVTERRLLQRAAAQSGAVSSARGGKLAVDVAAARAEILRRLLSLGGKTEAAGLGPALALLDQAEDALTRGAEQEASALATEARRMGLLALAEPELSLRARALREEARGLTPWRRRAIRQLLPKEEPPTPEAVHLATAIRDQAARTRARRLGPLGVAAAALAMLALAVSLASPATWSSPWLAALCGALAGFAAAALFALGS